MKKSFIEAVKEFMPVGVLLLAVLIFASVIGITANNTTQAHNGGLSQTDYCHKDNKAGERHWHFTGTVERGGVCVDGIQVGNCEVVKVAYSECRKNRKCSWEKEARKARDYVDCFEKDK